MAEELVELCNSRYDHHTSPGSKLYYINNDEKIVCSECFTPYVLAQTELLAKVWARKIVIYVADEVVPHEGDFTFIEYVPTVDFMRPLLDASSFYTSMVFNDKVTFTIKIKNDTYTGVFTPDPEHLTEALVIEDLKPFFQLILEYHFNMDYHQLLEEQFDELQEAHRARYNSNAQQ